MVLVQLQDGTKVNFAKTPTPADVDFAFKKIQADRDRKAQEVAAATKAPESVAEKIGDFTGGTKIAQGLGQALANDGISKGLDEAATMQRDTQGKLIEAIKAKKASGGDATRLEQALQILNEDMKSSADSTEHMLNQHDLTGKEVVGDALQLGTTVLGAGEISKSATLGEDALKTGLKKKGIPTLIEKTIANPSEAGIIKGVVKGALKGAGKGALGGAGVGAAQGVAQGLKSDEDASGVVESGLKGALFGGAFGAALGGITGGVSGGLKGKKLSDAVITAQEESGIRPTLDKTIIEKQATNPEFGTLVKEAQKQGYSEKEINFLATVQDADKPVLKKMFDITAKAQTDPRQVVRAGDILGDNATHIVNQVEKQNRAAGKAVDLTAKALKGQVVDATPVRNKAMSLLESAGVTTDEAGKQDWTKSVFSKTPQIQKKIQQALSDLPAGEIDAYDLHNFKKSIDEVVEFGVNGEGLKGKSENILKGIRREADGVLDSNFEAYNEANTEFKVTRDFIDKVKEVTGKKVDFSTKQGGQAFGQAFRSAFSNNKSRPRTLALIEELQNIAKERGLDGSEQSLLDQALYVNMLEDQFGSQAATGLASEVRKGVEHASKVVDAVRSPLKGVGNLAADLYEKSRNISAEQKKEILKKFLK